MFMCIIDLKNVLTRFRQMPFSSPCLIASLFDSLYKKKYVKKTAGAESKLAVIGAGCKDFIY